MMNFPLTLDYASRIPIYEQIVNEIERYVAIRILQPHEQMPSIREMALELGINPNTVKKAYTELESRGIIMSMSTKGTYIADNIEVVIENKINNEIDKIKELIDNLSKLGVTKDEILSRIGEV